MLRMILDRDSVNFKSFQKMVDDMMAASQDANVTAYDSYRQLMKQTRSIRYHMSSGDTVFIDSTHMLVAALEDYFDSRRVTPDTDNNAAKTPPSTMIFEIVYQGQHKTTLSSSQPTATTAASASNSDDAVDIAGNHAPDETNNTATCGNEESNLDPQQSYNGDVRWPCTEQCNIPVNIQDLLEQEVRKAKLNTLSNTFNKAKYALKRYKAVEVIELATIFAVVLLAVKGGRQHWRFSPAAAES